MEHGGIRHRRLWLAVLTTCWVLVLGTIVWAASVLAEGGLKPQDTAGLIGLVVGAMSLVAAVAALRRRAGQEADPEAAAARLRHRVRVAEGRQWRQLLGGDRAFIDLRYDVPHSSSRSASPPPGFAGRMSRATDDFLVLSDRRLVITGAPGAGKAVLALALLLGLTERNGTDLPVPVRLSLSGWDPQVDFEEWLVERLVQDYDREPRVARDLVEQRRVLPILDGLDEMDETVEAGTGPDPADATRVETSRARAAVERIDEYQDGARGLPLVVTCRTAWYERLESVGSGIPDALRIEIRPVAADQARAYLAHRMPQAQDRWSGVLRILGEATGSGQFLARAMSTPWRLTLAVTAYGERGDPGELLRHDSPAALDEDLLRRYIPAATRLHPPRRGSCRPHQVHHWLRQLALHAQRQEASGASPGLAPHQLWPLAGRRRVRAVDAALTSLVILAGAAVLLLKTGAGPDMRHLPAATGIAVLVLVLLLRAGSSGVPAPQGGKLRRIRTPDGRRLLVHRLRGAAVVALAVLVFHGVASGGLVAVVLAVLTAGLVLSLVSELAAGTRERHERSASHPRQLLRDDINSGLSFSALFSLTFGTVVGYSGDYVVGVGAGVLGGLACGMVWWTGAGRRYFAFLLCAWTRRLLPWRLVRFLEWAYGAGLLRVSGSTYQFRHKELQTWLLRHPTAPSG
ncbi:NACHT domain-containing protein [Streptomyces cyaneochromogenes]|uniref:NACHT domain-containing protein n=1 Tax=Streptomyces cyaneochromogenes TaxID=2496836 RepID=A0A3Q9ENP4_9ACTN|nr:NACHT domain-containing protein [Streptomyces cyaneochromogenes]AZQ35915.1 NACHT domain-containing protein [Streptomyces cyaneochromogenes]